MTFTERTVKETGCCTDLPWWNNWYGMGEYYNVNDGAGFGTSTTATTTGYANNNSNSYFDEREHWGPGTPLNDGPDLTYHSDFNNNYEPYFRDLW